MKTEIVTISLLACLPAWAEPEAAEGAVGRPEVVQAAPAQPEQAAEPEQAAPAQPEQAAEPEQPAPAQPEQAAEPEQAAPAQPEQAAEPEQAAPAQPEQAAEPEQPAPAQPEQAAEPEQPAPAQPEQAAEPEQPAPAQPAQPTPAATTRTQDYRGIVKIEVAACKWDYATPWQTGNYLKGYGTGFLVGPRLFMTNAHVVANAERIFVSPYADARKYEARVLHVAHDADLALVEVLEEGAFADVPPLQFSDSLPHLEDEVRAIGYPIGGNHLSVTRGIVSRIDTTTYSHPRNVNHLTVQVDAAINPGNSGGPVLMGDKVVGVVFQGLLQANSTGYMIPVPVINRFLQDVADGHYDGYVELGALFTPLVNPGMRRHYHLGDADPGVLVGEVAKGGSCDGVLQVGDVVQAINGHAVDRSGMIELDGERVQMEELAERLFKDDKLTMRVLRNGETLEVTATLSPLRARAITGSEYDTMPRYVQFAGLVFQPLQLDVIQAHRLNSTDFMVLLSDFLVRGGSVEKEDLVVVTTVLADEVNENYTGYERHIVTKVNGVEVKGLSHLYSLLYPAEGQPRPDYTVIEFEDVPRPMVIDNTVVDSANERVSARYNIPQPARLK